MQIGPFTLTRTKALQLQPLSGRGGWWSVIREPFMGAWQRNAEVNMDTVLTYFAVFACVTLIASDIAKLCLRLVEKDSDGIWTETESASFSPVLRKPNRFQTIGKFIEQWIVSKLIHGNTYVLKQRDNRGGPGNGNVVAMYVLDPTRVTPMVATDGAVYYEVKRDDLSGLREEKITIPASEIIHDTMVSLYHPLVGVSPLYASGLAATQGLSIQGNSNTFFSKGSNPSGVLTGPIGMTDEQVTRLKALWEAGFTGENVGRVAILAGELKYQAMTMTAVDSQLIEQLKWTADTVCSTFHVPPYMIGVGPPPPYANVEPLLQQYFSQCLQTLIVGCEWKLDEGLGLIEKIEGRQLGTEFDINDLIWMDTATKTTAAQTSIKAGMTPNEVRKRYHGLARVTGGDAVYMQQQDYSLAALAERDANDPFAKPAPALPAVPASDTDDEDEELMAASFASALHTKAIAEGLYAG